MKIQTTMTFLMTVVCLLGGCAKEDGGKVFRRSDTVTRTLTPDDANQLRLRLRGLVETYIVRINQGCDDLEAKSTDPELRKRLRAIKTRQTSAALSSAVGTQPVVDLLDLAAQVTLARIEIETYDLPMLGEIVRPILVAVQKSETEVWALVNKVVTPEQSAEFHQVIDAWCKENPDQNRVSHVRFSDFAAFSIRNKPGSENGPSSVFALLYIDPLAKLDPLAAEVAESRAFGERVVYLMQRLPILLQLQVDGSTAKVLESPVVTNLVNTANKISQTTDQLAKTVDTYPELLTKERSAAINQVDEKLTVQHKMLFDNIQKQQDQVAVQLQTTNQLIDKVRQGISDVKTIGPDTVKATNQTIEMAFSRLYTLVVILLVGIPIAVIATKLVTRRLR